MKRTIATLAGGVLALGLAVGGAALPAIADEAPPTPDTTEVVTPAVDEPTTPPAENATTEDTITTESVVADTPAPSYVLALWLVPGGPGNIWEPDQTLADSVTTSTADLSLLDNSEALTCGSYYQVDLYLDDDTTAGLLDGGVLHNPNDPTEHLAYDAVEGNPWKYLTTDACETPHLHPCACDSVETLSTATDADDKGWGDIKSADPSPWKSNGIHLQATATEEAYAYLDITFQLSKTEGSLDSVVSSVAPGTTYGIIIHNSTWNIHYENDGQYWTITPGLFPETSPGFYSTYDLSEATQDVTIDEVAVWVNPGGDLVLESQEYPCFVQPFAAAVVPPTTTPSTPVKAQLAMTGGDDAQTQLIGIAGTVFLAIGGVLVFRRRILGVLGK